MLDHLYQRAGDTLHMVSYQHVFTLHTRAGHHSALSVGIELYELADVDGK